MEKTNKLINLLKNNNLTICSAESYTGGGFANEITNTPGASKVFKGSIICYSNDVKESILKVNKKTLEEKGAISYECCKEMAINAKNILNADISVSFTGNAGPTGDEGKEVGLVYIGVCYKENINIYELHLSGSREFIKSESISYALDKIYDIII